MDVSSDENSDAESSLTKSMNKTVASSSRMKFVMNNDRLKYFYKPQIHDDIICFKNTSRDPVFYSNDFDSGLLALKQDSWIIGKITDITYRVDPLNDINLLCLLEMETITNKISNRRQFIEIVRSNISLSEFQFSESKKILKLDMTDNSEYFAVPFSKFKNCLDMILQNKLEISRGINVWSPNYNDELEEFLVIGVEDSQGELIDISGHQMDIVYNPVKSIICAKTPFECPRKHHLRIGDIGDEKIKKLSIWEFYLNPDTLGYFEIVDKKRMSADINDKLISIVEKLIDEDVSEWFEYHVDFDDYPNYTSLIAYPMCLDSILERLRNKYYRHVAAVHNDVYRIYLNASTYNKPGTDVPDSAKKMLKIYIKSILSCNLEPLPWFPEFLDGNNSVSPDSSQEKYQGIILSKDDLKDTKESLNLKSEDINCENSKPNKNLISATRTSPRLVKENKDSNGFKNKRRNDLIYSESDLSDDLNNLENSPSFELKEHKKTKMNTFESDLTLGKNSNINNSSRKNKRSVAETSSELSFISSSDSDDEFVGDLNSSDFDHRTSTKNIKQSISRRLNNKRIKLTSTRKNSKGDKKPVSGRVSKSSKKGRPKKNDSSPLNNDKLPRRSDNSPDFSDDDSEF
ncbi:PH-interacting protein [Smittium mucronatum]|uniref:PH-interacting protein n=1 Tax=Smittium mucronatum TaxID=133383 RepID=A0A1R0GTU1_9FUNG|nr:PH-interacting protein [Smittium mucronatum]